MGRSNHSGGGCFSFLFLVGMGMIFGMVILSIMLGVLSISISQKENGVDISFDVIPSSAEQVTK